MRRSVRFIELEEKVDVKHRLQNPIGDAPPSPALLSNHTPIVLVSLVDLSILDKIQMEGYTDLFC